MMGDMLRGGRQHVLRRNRFGSHVRVGDEAYQKMLKQPRVRPMEFLGLRPIGLVLVDPGRLPNRHRLATWIQRGIDFVC
jgi:hypothetical protein